MGTAAEVRLPSNRYAHLAISLQPKGGRAS